MQNNEIAIQTENLTRRFGALTAVDRLSLAVPRGVIFGFLGPNGAGKPLGLVHCAGLYLSTLGPLARLLQRREHTILEVVIVEDRVAM